MHFLDPLDPAKRLRHRLQALVELVRRQNVNVPTRQPRRQTNVLTTLADRQAQLILANHHRPPTKLKAQADLRHFRRLQRVLDQNLAALVPPDNVDLLTVQFVHDVLDPAPANANARPHRVNLRIHRRHRHLRPVPRLARHRLDLDDVLRNLRNLNLKQTLDEVRVRTAQHNLHLAPRIPNIQHQAPHPRARLEHLPGDLLAPRHERLGTIDRHHQRATLVPLRLPRHDVPDTLAELLQNRVPLVVTEPLDHHLLERLRRDPAQLRRLQLQRLSPAEHLDRPSHRVDLRRKLLHVQTVEELPKRRHHRPLKIADQHALLDVPVPRDRVQDPVHFSRVHHVDHSELSNCPRRPPAPDALKTPRAPDAHSRPRPRESAAHAPRLRRRPSFERVPAPDDQAASHPGRTTPRLGLERLREHVALPGAYEDPRSHARQGTPRARTIRPSNSQTLGTPDP